jgi:hypothetical protein
MSSGASDPGPDGGAAPQLRGSVAHHLSRHPSGDHQIIGLITLFTVAILVVVCAVWALTAVGGWWMLALAVAVHLLASAVVLAEVAAVMSDQSLTMAVLDRIASRRHARRERPVAR